MSGNTIKIYNNCTIDANGNVVTTPATATHTATATAPATATATHTHTHTHTHTATATPAVSDALIGVSSPPNSFYANAGLPQFPTSVLSYSPTQAEVNVIVNGFPMRIEITFDVTGDLGNSAVIIDGAIVGSALAWGFDESSPRIDLTFSITGLDPSGLFTTGVVYGLFIEAYGPPPYDPFSSGDWTGFQILSAAFYTGDFGGGGPTNPPNTAPTCGPLAYTVDTSETTQISAINGLLSNASDPDGDPLTVESDGVPVLFQNLNATTGAFEIRQLAPGVYTASYTVSDDQGGMCTSTVTVTVWNRQLYGLFEVSSDGGATWSTSATQVVGSTVDYRFTVGNTLNQTNEAVGDVLASMPQLGITNVLVPGGTLAIGETRIITKATPGFATLGDVPCTTASSVIRTASAKGTGVDSNLLVTAANSFTSVTCIEPPNVAPVITVCTTNKTTVPVGVPGVGSFIVSGSFTDAQSTAGNASHSIQVAYTHTSATDATTAVFVPVSGTDSLVAGTFSTAPFVYPTGTAFGTYHVWVRLVDALGAVSEPCYAGAVDAVSPNTPPVANPDEYSVFQGSTLTVPAPLGVLSVLANDVDADGDTLTAVLVNQGTLAASGTATAPTGLAFFSDGSFTLTNAVKVGVYSFQYKVNDGTDDSAPTTVTINVLPVAPVIESCGPSNSDPIAINTGVVDFSITITDVGSAVDSHEGTVFWGDGTSTSVTMGVGVTVLPSIQHSYALPGVYQISSVVWDTGYPYVDAQNPGVSSGLVVCDKMVIVYDPVDGCGVTAAAKFVSPIGAQTADAGLASGKASFGLNTKYKKGASVPTSKTKFKFHYKNKGHDHGHQHHDKEFDIKFESESFDYLVVSGTDLAIMQGVGYINKGIALYKFYVVLFDGYATGVNDRIRIRITQVSGGAVVYDNAPTGAPGSGTYAALNDYTAGVNTSNGKVRICRLGSPSNSPSASRRASRNSTRLSYASN